MQEQLKKALEFSNYKQTFAIQRKVLKEKNDAKLTFGYNGGLFKIDRNLLVFVEMLINKGRSSNIVLIDDNQNPILVEDLHKFHIEIFDRYFSATYEYFEEYQKLKKSRSVEKLIEL